MKLTPILRGERVQMPAHKSFGVVRRPAEADGLAWETAEECGFVSLEEVAEAAKALRKRQRERDGR